MSYNITPYMRRLRRQHRAHQGGLLLREALRLTGYALISLLVFAAADFFLAFSMQALITIRTTLFFALTAIALLGIVRCARFTLRDYARRVDRVQRNRRHDIFTAFELSRAPREDGRGNSLQHYLVDACVNTAADRLATLRWRHILPAPRLRRQARVLGVQLLIVLVTLGVPQSASAIVLERLWYPERDRPPYSPYTFTVTPTAPEVRYGHDVELAVEITGAPVEHAVWLWTRRGDRVQRAACFQDAPTRYAQRLEQVVEPLEFAFATGRARSEWYPIELLLDPRIVSARATLVPPAYSGLPTQTVRAGERPIAGLAETGASLELVSNRPLLDGTLQIQANDGSGEVQELAGTVVDRHRIRFDWTLAFPGELAVRIRDLRGTSNEQPFTLEQVLVPDEPPRAVITHPGAFALATPDAVLQLTGYAEDDLALHRVDLVRGLVGFRDRIESLGPDRPRQRWTMESELDMATLGVVPGDVLEFYLEAQDSNPAWTGIGSSEVTRIEVIDREAYADMLRARIRLEDYIERYRIAMQSVQDLKQALQEMLDALENPDGDVDELTDQLSELLDDYDHTQSLLDRLAEDFPAFASEAALQETLREISETLHRHRPALADRTPDDERLPRRLEMVRDNLAAFDEQMTEHSETARTVAEVMRVFQLTQQYLRLVQTQEELVRRMDRYREPPREPGSAAFESFRREEAALREAVLAYREELIRRANALSEEHDELKASALEFADGIDTLEISETLQATVDAATNRRRAAMTQQAELALERMRQLLTDCQGTAFGGLMECELRFTVRENARQTLQQMMMAQAGLGQGAGTGDGYSMNAHTPLNVPMYGPGRSDFAQQTTDAGSGDGAGAPGSALIGNRARHTMRPASDAGLDGTAPPLEQAPDKYRDALRRYYQLEKETP